METKSIGPSYKSISLKYNSDEASIAKLAAKVIEGGNGVWGENMMSAHPQLKNEKAAAMVRYIASLDEEELKPSLPLKGTLTTNAKYDAKQDGSYFLTVKYTDKGGEPIGPLTTQEQYRLRSAKIEAENSDNRKDVWNIDLSDPNITVVDVRRGFHISFKDISNIILRLKSNTPNLNLKINLDRLNGKTIATAKIPDTQNKTFIEVKIPVGDPGGAIGMNYIWFLKM